MKKWDQRFMDLASHIAQWSKDPSTKVGAVIVDSSRRVIGLGYNGFARGVRDLDERYAEKMVKYRLVVHAEANAILNSNSRVRECTLYASKAPCSECAKLIVQSGIIRIISPSWSLDKPWAEDGEFSRLILLEGGVDLA